MSNAIFPTLQGLKIDISRAPEFVTKIQTATSGREGRASFTATPKWKYKLQFEFLRQGQLDGATHSELHTLMGFFMQRRGSFDSFLYQDQDDYSCDNQLIGVGDGVTTSFQVVRTLGGFTEPVCNVQSIVVSSSMWTAGGGSMWTSGSNPMWLGGGGYTLSQNGMLTFATAPAVGVNVYWSGTYYYRARFADDSLSFDQFLRRFWEAKTVEFVASLGTKV